MYQFPAWKYWTVIIVMVLGTVFALPNMFGEDPALQLSREDRQEMQASHEQHVREVLKKADVAINASHFEKGRLVLRFPTVEDQLKAREAMQKADGREYTVALAYASRMPELMRKIGLKPMSLGLDLRGGVHFVYEVAVQDAVDQALQGLERDFRALLRDKRIAYTGISTDRDTVRVTLRDAADLDTAKQALAGPERGVQIDTDAGTATLSAKLTPEEIKKQRDFAIEKNLTTLRNRVDELGISEPVIMKQGVDRIVVELPGVQDPNEAIRVLGATATLEFRMVDEANNPFEAEQSHRVPLGSKLYKRRDSGQPILLKREIIASGDQLTGATAEPTQDGPGVSVRLDARAGQQMLKTTQQNLGRLMAVVYIEKKRLGEGEQCKGTRSGNFCTEEEVINAATIRGVFSTNFQITGLQLAESKELALLLRAGSLAVPLSMIEQRTVGPSLGQDNIAKGVRAMLIGLVLTFIFMAIYYRAFGWVANAVLLSNLVLTVGLLSALQASLSLPGIAAVVFHLGIAVDANILIYERIREELRNGNSPQSAINAGFERAFATIADSNVTTLIAGVVLFAFGTGTIRSFAIVMTLGILTSLFTSVVGSRALVHFMWGRRRRLDHLSI